MGTIRTGTSAAPTRMLSQLGLDRHLMTSGWGSNLNPMTTLPLNSTRGWQGANKLSALDQFIVVLRLLMFYHCISGSDRHTGKIQLH